ncbi:MAG: thiamine biosynthesis protein ThiI [Planctomycetota bacterium]|jgi:thiamine biosynthesis protein ThiI
MTQIALQEPDVLVVRYGEIALKGGNRKKYENALGNMIRRALKPIGAAKVSVVHGRLYVYPEERAMRMAKRTAQVFGVKSVSPAWSVEASLESIVASAQPLVDDLVARKAGSLPITFRVRARRADKLFPMTSIELECAVAEAVMPGPEFMSVKLKNADYELGIEVRGKENYVFLERLKGPGGLPVGTSGRGLCLLSGGIDSPVAAWLGMRRGLSMGFVSFHSFPYLGEGSKRKVADLARAVAHFQGKAQLYVVPFAEVQESIRDNCTERYRTVLYRRMMGRIASALCRKYNYGVLLTGENLGQVASQTMKNMTLISDAADHLILRPLITYDKEDVINIARRIGTFDISIRPEPDCCTVFQPSSPVIHGNAADCDHAESKLDMEGLVNRAIAGTEVHLVDPEE